MAVAAKKAPKKGKPVAAPKLHQPAEPSAPAIVSKRVKDEPDDAA